MKKILFLSLVLFAFASCSLLDNFEVVENNSSDVVDNSSDVSIDTNIDSSTIVVVNPTPVQEISSPLFISGKAKGYWFFEGSFPVQLTTLAGVEISSGFVTAKSDWMSSDFVEFEGSLEFKTDEKAGILILKNDNPSGLPENEVKYSVPVKFLKLTPVVNNDDKLTPVVNNNDIVEAYIRDNISALSPIEAVLGGTWYVTNVEFGNNNTVKVFYEDGHIISSFSAKYIVDENNNISMSDITVIPESI